MKKMTKNLKSAYNRLKWGIIDQTKFLPDEWKLVGGGRGRYEFVKSKSLSTLKNHQPHLTK